jgi:hypothetical protein
MRRRAIAAPLLSVLLAASGCADVAAPPASEATIRSGIRPEVVSTLSGLVIAPAGAISAGGANVISAGGNNVISAGGSNVISAGGSNLSARGLLAVSEKPLAGAVVYLADAAGEPIAGLSPALSDSRGRFQFFNVPKGYAYVLAARIKTAAGKEVALRTMARVGDGSALADLSPASSVVTSAAVAGLKDLGALDLAKFEAALEAVGQRLGGEALPDLGDRAALEAHIQRLQQADPTLKPLLDAVRQSLQDTADVSLEGLKRQLAAETRPVGANLQPMAPTPRPEAPTPEPLPAPVTATPVTPAPTPTPTPVATAAPAQPTPTPTPFKAGMRRLTLSPNLGEVFFRATANYPMTVYLASVDGTFTKRLTLSDRMAKVTDTVLAGEPLSVVYKRPQAASVTVQYVTLPADPAVTEVLLPLAP